jgi:nucleoside-diphosphate-sugar epimerase
LAKIARVFVAGGAGLAGSAIIRQLVEDLPDCQVTATYHRQSPNFQHSRVNYCRIDLSAASDISGLLNGCDAAVLATARSGGAAALNSSPAPMIEDATLLPGRLLAAAVEAKVSQVVLCSSVTVYQPFDGYIREDQLNLDEDPPGPHFGIGWANRYCEKLAQYWSTRSECCVTVARSANIFGPWGVFHPQRSNFIPALIRKAVQKDDPFEVWGDPTVTRDVIFVDDFAAGILALLRKRPTKGSNFEIFNVGSGQRTQVGDAVEWCLKAANHSPNRIHYSQSQPSSIPFRALDCSKIERMTGWSAPTPIEKGIEATTSWWREHQHSWER